VQPADLVGVDIKSCIKRKENLMSQSASSEENASRSVPKKEKAEAKSQDLGIMDAVMDRITKAISQADEAAAAERVDSLRASNPAAKPAELVNMLIRQKCLQTGAVGAVTSGASLIPGLGTLVALTFGVAADIGLTFKLQAELVLEIATVHGHQLSPTEKRNAVLIVTGISSGANKLLEKAGAQVAKQATEYLAEKAVVKAIPVLGVAASAGSNILSTYIIGRRADAYFSLGPEAVGDWAESLRALTGVDERVVMGWLAETTERSWQLINSSAQSAAGAVIVAGQAAGEVIVISASKVSELLSGAGQGVIRGISSATGTVVEVGQWAGASVVAMASTASESAIETGQWAGSGLAAGAGSAAESVVDAGKWVGENVTAGASNAGKWVASWFTRGEDEDTEESANLSATTPETPPAEDDQKDGQSDTEERR
jgi:hypothetical protein